VTITSKVPSVGLHRSHRLRPSKNILRVLYGSQLMALRETWIQYTEELPAAQVERDFYSQYRSRAGSSGENVTFDDWLRYSDNNTGAAHSRGAISSS